MPKISAAERTVTSSTKNGAVLFVLFSLICSVLSSFSQPSITTNLRQPLRKKRSHNPLHRITPFFPMLVHLVMGV